MKSDKPLYLVSSRPGATRAAPGRHSHLRLVHSVPMVVVPAAVAPVVIAARPAPARSRPRSLSRPFGQRMVQAASDVAVLAVALIVGLRPNA
jgi:hypothetical protein